MPDNWGLLLQSAIILEGACFVTVTFPAESTSSAWPLGPLQQEPPAQEQGGLSAAHSSAPAGIWGAEPAVSPSSSAQVCTQNRMGHMKEESTQPPQKTSALKLRLSNWWKSPGARCYLDKALQDLSHAVHRTHCSSPSQANRQFANSSFVKKPRI